MLAVRSALIWSVARSFRNIWKLGLICLNNFSTYWSGLFSILNFFPTICFFSVRFVLHLLTIDEALMPDHFLKILSPFGFLLSFSHFHASLWPIHCELLCVLIDIRHESLAKCLTELIINSVHHLTVWYVESTLYPTLQKDGLEENLTLCLHKTSICFFFLSRLWWINAYN